LQTRIDVGIPSPTCLIRYRLFYYCEVPILSGCGISPPQIHLLDNSSCVIDGITLPTISNTRYWSRYHHHLWWNNEVVLSWK